MDSESFDLGIFGNFQIEAILEYIDISDSVFTCGTFVLDILTVADGCQLIYNFGNISIITSIYLCIWKQYTDVCTDTIKQLLKHVRRSGPDSLGQAEPARASE